MQLGSLNRHAVALHAGDEPIPGYRLIRRRGRGGFGEVWEAAAPGQFLVALKFVHLSDQARGGELRALDFVRGIHHPNLLANFGAWQIGDTLVIGMELADGSLWDRFLEANQSGDRGIPRGELLGYLSDVAAGVDHLNGYSHTVEGRASLGIQHRDLKPPNILLFGGGAKVADLGMARVMEGEVAGHTGIWTFPYAAPEFFRGETTHHSDQYGLAVTYCQLRGGRLPFGGNAATVTAGHLFAPPNLDTLPEPERPIVARALAKVAGDRWPNCRAFVEALRALPADAVPDRLVDPAGPSGIMDDLRSPVSTDSSFLPDDSRSGFLTIQSEWQPDTADSCLSFPLGSAESLAAAAVPSRPSPLDNDFSLWSSFDAVRVAPAEPAAVWEETSAQSPARSARSLRRVVVASLLGFTMVALATSGSQPEPRVGRDPIDSPLAMAQVIPPPVAEATDPRDEPSNDDPTLSAAAPVLAANPPGEPATILPVESPVPTPIALDLTPGADTAAPSDLVLEGPREMEDLPPAPPLVIVGQPVPAGPAPALRSPSGTPATTRPDPLADRIASTSPVGNPFRDVDLRRTRAPLAAPRGGDPVAAEAAYTRGRELFRQSDFAGAIRAFDESLRLNPGHATSHLARAITRDRAGEPRNALADYAEVIRARPQDPTAYLSRGQIYHELGEYDQAITDFGRAIELRPDAGDPWFRRGLARYRSGDYAGAVDDFTVALQHDPKNAYAAGFRDESLARSEARLGQTIAGQPRPALDARGVGLDPRPNPTTLPAPLRETNYLAPPPITQLRPGPNPPATRPSAAPPTRPTQRRPPVLRRLIPWPFSKPK